MQHSTAFLSTHVQDTCCRNIHTTLAQEIVAAIVMRKLPVRTEKFFCFRRDRRDRMAVKSEEDSRRETDKFKSGRLRFWSCGDIGIEVMSGRRRQDVEGGLVDHQKQIGTAHLRLGLGPGLAQVIPVLKRTSIESEGSEDSEDLRTKKNHKRPVSKGIAQNGTFGA